MAWLHDNGDDNELSRMEEDDGEKEGLIEETDEEVIVTERPGAPSLPPLRSGRPKPRKAAKAKPAKARPKKAAPRKKKVTAKAAKRKKPARSAKRGKRR